MAEEDQSSGPTAPAPAKPVVYTSIRKQSAPPTKPKVVKIEPVQLEKTDSVEDKCEGAISTAKAKKKPAKKKQPKTSPALEPVDANAVSAEATTEVPKTKPKAAKTQKADPPAEDSQEIKPPVPRKNVERKPVPRPTKALSDSEATRSEIEQLRIRFPDLEQSPCEGGSRLVMTVPILDPEFPYALESVWLQMDLPSGYPKSAALSCALLNDGVPVGLKAKFKSQMDAAARSLLGQQALRAMIRFLEKNLETMLTPTANPSGFKFVSHTAPATEATASTSPPAPRVIAPPAGVVEEYRKKDDDLVMPEEYYEALRQLDVSDTRASSRSPGYDTGMGEDGPSHSTFLREESLPTKSRFKPGILMRIEPVSRSAMAGAIQLQFANTRLKGIGLLLVTQLGVLMRCDRCRAATPVEDVRPDADRLYACRKCNTKASLSLRIDAVHEHNQCAGYLRCRGGVPGDWLPSTVQITCGQCTPDDPALGSMRIEAVKVGELVNCRCRSCHRDLSLEIGRVDWIAVPGLHQDAARPRRGAIPKLPSQVGEPLPDRGACKHYRKSLRWFRFPCCGKAYPCDTCHDEDPANGGHTAEWASRHICGMCSRELPISQKECICGAEPASTRRSTHWEGGKGMRDQTLMSRKDNKKYRNLTKPVKPASSK